MSAERAERLASVAADEGLDALIVGDLVTPGDSIGPGATANLRWLTAFTGTSGLAVVGAQQRLFLTDFRYVERAEREVGDAFELRVVEQRLLTDLVKVLKGKIGFDDAHTSVQNLRKLEDGVGEGVDLLPAAGLVERLRRQKDADEQRAIAAAATLADEVYDWTLEQGLEGNTEREVTRRAEARMRELGAEPSFPTIVAGGPNGALPHAESSDRSIERGELVVFDMGAIVDGYCSDCTRTFAAGREPDGEAAEAYELVRQAQAKALEGIRAGVSGPDADSVARDLIGAAGHADHFGHGLGHGVGIEVHEAPRLGQRSEDILAEGDVVTVEPGVYLPGRFGIRIEDLVVVTADGYRNLSSLPKELRVVS
jgi:Xaa-Pro aminopeptidase